MDDIIRKTVLVSMTIRRNGVSDLSADDVITNWLDLVTQTWFVTTTVAS